MQRQHAEVLADQQRRQESYIRREDQMQAQVLIRRPMRIVVALTMACCCWRHGLAQKHMHAVPAGTVWCQPLGLLN